MPRLLAIMLLLGLAGGLDPAAARAEDPAGTSADAPHADLMALAAPPPGWQPLGVPAAVAGEALFNVIDGGAEIYMQTGFRRAVFASVQNAVALTVNLEIYEMQDPAAARAIFDHKTAGSGRAIPLGQGARLEAYYLNFWHGRFQVTVAGYTSSPETVAAIRTVAAAVAKRLPEG
jgi:hypothetical protein